MNVPSTVTAGLCSYACRYAIGFPGFTPREAMTIPAFLQEASRLGFKGVQICENLNIWELNGDELAAVREKARELGLFIELGMRDINGDNLMRHLELARVFSSVFLRVVIGSGITPDKAIDMFQAVLPFCRKYGIKIGIENHFDLRSNDLLEIARALSDEHIGLILDTTNGLGFIETPEETLEIFAPYLISVHLKDYTVKKVEAGYFITGTPLGKGLLDCEGLMKRIVRLKPDITVMLEMTIRREENRSVEEIVTWERKAIEESKLYLDKLISKTTP